MWIKPARLGVRQNILHKAFGAEVSIVLEPTGELSFMYGSSGRDGAPHILITSFGQAEDEGIGAGQIRVFKATRTAAKADRWTHIAVARDLAAGRVRWYVNGALVVESATTVPQARASNAPLRLGAGYLKHYQGLIDEVAIWNRPLTAREIKGVHAHAPALSSVARGLVGLWLGDGSARDFLGKHHGQVGKGVTYTADRHGGVKGALPSLLTHQGRLHPVGNTKDCLAFHTNKEKDPHIIIALTGAPMIQKLFIENRRGGGGEERASGRTVWVSGDKKSWQRVWTAPRLAPSWMIKLKAPIDAAYVKIGLLDTNYLHLRRVKIYGRSGGIPLVTRLALADRIEVNNGNVLLGTIKNRSYTVTTSYGKIEVSARRVVGIVPTQDKPTRVRLVQTDSQVIVGTMADQTVQLSLPAGSTLDVPPASIRQLSYRVSKDRPAGFTASQPVVLLRSGDRLIWTECRSNLQLAGPWGTVDLPLKSLQRVERTDMEGRGHRAWFPGGTVLAGTLGPKKLTLKLKAVPELKIASKDVRLIALPTKAPTSFEPAAAVLLHDGSRLLGRLEHETLALRTEFGQVTLYVGDLKTLTCDAKRAAHVTITTWDGTMLRGQLAAPRLTCRIAPNGPRVSLMTTQIASMTQPLPLLRPKARKTAEELIVRLGSESYKDREAATKELVKMGKGVIPLLKKHLTSPDPEVRQRIEDIIRQSDPKRTEPVPRPDVDPRLQRLIFRR